MKQKWKIGETLQRYVPKFIRHDFWRKLFAVIFAAIVFKSVYLNLEKTEIRNIPGVQVEFVLLDDFVFRTSEPPLAFVTLTVQGRSSVLERLSSKDFKVIKKVDLRVYDDQSKEIRLDINDVKSDYPSVTVTGLKPLSIPLDLDRIVTREHVPITPVYDSGELPTGFTVTGINFPAGQETVKITGPGKILRGIESVQTEPISLKKVTQSFSYVADLKAPGNAKLSFDRVTVNVAISGQELKPFEALPLQVLMGGTKRYRSLTVDVKPSDGINVVLEGDKMRVNSVASNAIHPYIDIAGLKPGKYEIQVKCWCDDNDVKIKSISPQMVSVTLQYEHGVKNEEAPGK